MNQTSMMTKMKMNKHNQYVLDTADIVLGWLSGNNFSSVISDDTHDINIYNEWCRRYDEEDNVIQTIEQDTSDNYVEKCLENWTMPDHYKDLDIVRWLNNRELTYEQRERLHMEIEMFRERGMIPVLKFLRYLVDVCEENNIVLGVGRGSSVASYCLYLLGVHRIDSIKYKLDIKEFLK